MTVLQKAIAILALIATLAVVATLGIRQYGNARVAAQELGTVKEAVSEAVQERKQATKADAQAAIKKATMQQEMRSAGNLVRKEMQNDMQDGLKAPTGQYRPCTESRDDRVLNDFIQRGNRAIESSR